jgi:hypothetical protein
MEDIKVKIKETIGYWFEILFFVISGFFISINYIVSFIFFVLGVVLSVIVGREIKKNAIEELKNG